MEISRASTAILTLIRHSLIAVSVFGNDSRDLLCYIVGVVRLTAQYLPNKKACEALFFSRKNGKLCIMIKSSFCWLLFLIEKKKNHVGFMYIKVKSEKEKTTVNFVGFLYA